MDTFEGKPLRDVQASDVKRLVSDRVPEGLHIEYKQELSLDTTEEKKKFLRNVSAFANAEGGLILFGIEEERDEQGKPTGIPLRAAGLKIANRDSTVGTIEDLLRDGVDERLPRGWEIRFVEVPESRYVLAMRIPPSFRGPHMVILGGERRFYTRTNRGKENMSTAQIRDIALRGESMARRVAEFISDRAEEMNRGKPCWLLHVVPLIRDEGALDVANTDTITALQPVACALGGDISFCLEGYRSRRNWPSGETTETTIFRDGSVEFYDEYRFNQPDKLFPYVMFHQDVNKCLVSVWSLYQQGMLFPPCAIALTLNHVKGWRLGRQWARYRPHSLPGELIHLGRVVLHDVKRNPKGSAKPLFDILWNALGMPHCPAYDEDGEYVGYDG